MYKPDIKNLTINSCILSDQEVRPLCRFTSSKLHGGESSTLPVSLPLCSMQFLGPVIWISVSVKTAALKITVLKKTMAFDLRQKDANNAAQHV